METPTKRPPGRPRTRPEGETNSEGVIRWRARLKELGGGEVRAYLGPDAKQALESMAKIRERGPLIERLILAEWHARKQLQRKLEEDQEQVFGAQP